MSTEQRHLLGLAIFIALMFTAAAGVRSAWAAPRAINVEECQNITHVAIVARAAAEANIPAEQTGQLLAKVFATPGPRSAELVRLILGAAYRSKDGARQFATILGMTCAATGGDLDSVLGQGV